MQRPPRFFTHLLAPLVALALFASPALAQDSLSQAEAAYREIDFEGSLSHAQAAIESGSLESDQLARAYELVGICSIALGEQERSREAFIRLLALTPDIQLDRSLSPSSREPFMEARGYWAAITERLGVDVDLVRRRGVLRVQLTDPIGMAQTVVVRTRLSGEEEYVESAEAAGETVYVEVAELSGEEGVEYTLELRDEHGNLLIQIGDEEVPEVFESTSGGGGGGGGGRSRIWLWTLIGVLSAGVVTTAIVTPILVNQSNTTNVSTDVTFEIF